MARILVVEDSPTQAKLLAALLESEGHHVETARTAEAAFATCLSDPFDLVLSDIVMPGANGFDLCARIKSHPRTGRVPVVLLTALERPREVIRGLEAGADGYIVKPYDDEAVLARLRRFAAPGEDPDPQPSAPETGRSVTVDRARLVSYLTAAFDDMLSAKRREYESRHAIEAILRMRDQFLNHVSHELRSPLATVHSFTSLMLDGHAGTLDDQQREYLEVVFSNSVKLQNLIDDLLEATRLQTRGLAIEPQSVGLSGLVASALLIVDLEGQQRVVSVEIPADLPPIQADPIRIKQVLVNLLDNALKFTAPGGRITMRAQIATRDPRLVQVAVSDDGAGMSAEALRTAFDLLYSGAEAADARQRGLGLGLFMCRELISRHGGDIWAESDPGHGTTVNFTLPRAQDTDGVPTDGERDAVPLGTGISQDA